MNISYKDIRALTDKEPIWYDENAVPRYAPISVELVPNIYANEVVFYEIECQNCGRRFLVEDSYKNRNIEKSICNKELLYGDPPKHGCIGDSMSSVPIRVVALYVKIGFEVREVTEYAGRDIKPDWAKE